MKVLLFVQSGDARPKVAYSNQASLRYMATCSQRTLNAVYAPLKSRWWLVECENAEAGRTIIANHAAVVRGDGVSLLRGGRILASGGRHE